VDIRDLVWALVGGDMLAARQWVADAERERFRWPELPMPEGLTPDEMAVAAGIVLFEVTRAS